ncbi:hypothetical protein A2V71_00175 [Candidatus Berkelbacteria bacterium RBG_13_40_8]|uniref:Transcriptional repressor PaaX-like central Cas2-like domain-containing protein n=1 Tax=Candidatus Berkelbacteria bacterium RBG_13_40_8 TaxID=1797467 RepID=A0A1F5DNK6_9BACT|nr:MAG: hypothetical protein A2V71_00175 [Candidatus Berkelbacteria bacterium RBG_13_40_8]
MNRKISLGERILLFLEKSDNLATLMSHPYLWGKDYPKKRTFYQTVYRLKETGYLTEIEKEGRKKYISTLKGKIKILAYLKKDKKWDKKWRIVVFDIPETKKEMREFFRGRLHDLGFRKMQDSVWISPYNIADKVEELIEFCNAKKYAHYLLVEELDNRDVLMNLFNISEENTIQKTRCSKNNV